MGLIFISVLWGKDKRMVIFGFCLLLFAGGIYRHQMFERPADNLDYYQKQQSIQDAHDREHLVYFVVFGNSLNYPPAAQTFDGDISLPRKEADKSRK